MIESREVSSTELHRLCEIGRKCSAIGINVSDMDRVELVAAIGFLSNENSDLKRVLEDRTEKLKLAYSKLRDYKGDKCLR